MKHLIFIFLFFANLLSYGNYVEVEERLTFSNFGPACLSFSKASDCYKSFMFPYEKHEKEDCFVNYYMLFLWKIEITIYGKLAIRFSDYYLNIKQTTTDEKEYDWTLINS